MASWTPGSYLIRDFAAHVEGLRAEDADGRVRAVSKIAKNRWRVESTDTERLTLHYESIEWSYLTLDPDTGSVISEVTMQWNQAADGGS